MISFSDHNLHYQCCDVVWSLFQAHNRLVADLDTGGFEVLETQSFANEVTSAMNKLKEKDVRIILGNFNESWARRVFCEAHRYYSDFRRDCCLFLLLLSVAELPVVARRGAARSAELTKYRSADQIKKNEVGWTRGMYGGRAGACRLWWGDLREK